MNGMVPGVGKDVSPVRDLMFLRKTSPFIPPVPLPNVWVTREWELMRRRTVKSFGSD